MGMTRAPRGLVPRISIARARAQIPEASKRWWRGCSSAHACAPPRPLHAFQRTEPPRGIINPHSLKQIVLCPRRTNGCDLSFGMRPPPLLPRGGGGPPVTFTRQHNSDARRQAPGGRDVVQPTCGFKPVPRDGVWTSPRQCARACLPLIANKAPPPRSSSSSSSSSSLEIALRKTKQFSNCEGEGAIGRRLGVGGDGGRREGDRG